MKNIEHYCYSISHQNLKQTNKKKNTENILFVKYYNLHIMNDKVFKVIAEIWLFLLFVLYDLIYFFIFIIAHCIGKIHWKHSTILIVLVCVS